VPTLPLLCFVYLSLCHVLDFLSDHLFNNFICEVLRGILSSYIL
jgi:hypothetical protein